MRHLKYVERYQRIQKLIIQQNTGTSEEFAERIGVSRRTLFEYLAELKDYGAEISFCRKRKTFFFANNEGMHLKLI